MNFSVTDIIGTPEFVPCMEVSLTQRLSNIVMYACGMRAIVLNSREVSFTRSVLYIHVGERFHCIALLGAY